MILDTTNRKLQIELTGSTTTRELSVNVDYIEISASGAHGHILSSLTNGTTAVDILDSPAADTQRQIKTITVLNQDTVPQSVKISVYDGTSSYPLTLTLLDAGDILGWTDNRGWYVQDAAGSTFGPTGPTGPAGADSTVIGPTGPAVDYGIPSAFTTRALVNSDNSSILVCATAQVATVNTGLSVGFGCSFKGAISFDGSATVTDVRTTGATNPWCALMNTGTDTYDCVGGKA